MWNDEESRKWEDDDRGGELCNKSRIMCHEIKDAFAKNAAPLFVFTEGRV